MSLLLNLLGTTALLGTAIATPTVAAMSNAKEDYWGDPNFYAVGIHEINTKLEVNATTDKKNQNVEGITSAKIEINWTDLGISAEDYQRIDWENSSFVLVSDIYYKNNILGNSGTIVPKRDYFLDIKPEFNINVKYPDTGKVTDSTRSVENSWEYIFSDNGETLTFDIKLSTNASTTKTLTWSYASFDFVNLAYAIIFN